MASDAMNKWMISSGNAQIGDLTLKPLRHPSILNTPLSAMRGQSEVFFLQTPSGERWVLKKFYDNQLPDQRYLKTVKNILPKDSAFISSYKRLVLSSNSLVDSGNSYYDGVREYFRGRFKCLCYNGLRLNY